ncbi:hypothetical protein ACJW30_05G111800 [Castanea mollissima]
MIKLSRVGKTCLNQFNCTHNNPRPVLMFPRLTGPIPITERSFQRKTGMIQTGKALETVLCLRTIEALKEITSTIGVKYWRFNASSCQTEMVGVTPKRPGNAESSIICDCKNNNTFYHVIMIVLKGDSLPGMLPPQLQNSQGLNNHFVPVLFNLCLSSSNCSDFISVFVNCLSGEISKDLGNTTTLTYMGLEANQFSGIVPPGLRDLIKLQTFRINDNNFRGIIPYFTQNRISDVKGPNQDFPMLRNMTGIGRLYV